jgi:hypothetical protein
MSRSLHARLKRLEGRHQACRPTALSVLLAQFRADLSPDERQALVDALDPAGHEWLHRQLAALPAGPVRDTVGERMKALLADADAALPAPSGASALPAAEPPLNDTARPVDRLEHWPSRNGDGHA